MRQMNVARIFTLAGTEGVASGRGKYAPYEFQRGFEMALGCQHLNSAILCKRSDPEIARVHHLALHLQTPRFSSLPFSSLLFSSSLLFFFSYLLFSSLLL